MGPGSSKNACGVAQGGVAYSSCSSLKSYASFTTCMPIDAVEVDSGPDVKTFVNLIFNHTPSE